MHLGAVCLRSARIRAEEIISREVKLPVGYSMVWSGQYEYMEKARKRLNPVIPLTLVIIFVLLRALS